MGRGTLLLLLALAVCSSALYDRFSAVRSLTTADFK
jgi:hypothetical protein